MVSKASFAALLDCHQHVARGRDREGERVDEGGGLRGVRGLIGCVEKGVKIVCVDRPSVVRGCVDRVYVC